MFYLPWQTDLQNNCPGLEFRAPSVLWGPWGRPALLPHPVLPLQLHLSPAQGLVWGWPPTSQSQSGSTWPPLVSGSVHPGRSSGPQGSLGRCQRPGSPGADPEMDMAVHGVCWGPSEGSPSVGMQRSKQDWAQGKVRYWEVSVEVWADPKGLLGAGDGPLQLSPVGGRRLGLHTAVLTSPWR